MTKEQDAFAAVPSRRAVRVDRRSLDAAVRSLGRETELQPTSGQCARSQGGGKPDNRTGVVRPSSWHTPAQYWGLCCCKHPGCLLGGVLFVCVFWGPASIAAVAVFIFLVGCMILGGHEHCDSGIRTRLILWPARAGPLLFFLLAI
jgi:hypothetical protein